jgi:hypothetical protein
VVADGDRLRALEVRVARDREGGVAFREVRERGLQGRDRAIEVRARASEPEPQIGRDLVVARTTGVELLREIADEVAESTLDERVDVLGGGVGESALVLRKLALELRERRDDRLHLRCVEDLRADERARPSDAPAHVLAPEAAIERQAPVERLEDRILRAREASAQSFVMPSPRAASAAS